MSKKQIEFKILDIQDQIVALEDEIQILLKQMAKETVKEIMPVLAEHFGG